MFRIKRSYAFKGMEVTARKHPSTVAGGRRGGDRRRHAGACRYPRNSEKGTVGTHTFFHPATISEGLEAVLPHVHEVVAVDIALMVIGTNAGTGGDRAVRQNGGDADAGVAGVEAIAHLALVATEEALATVADA